MTLSKRHERERRLCLCVLKDRTQAFYAVLHQHICVKMFAKLFGVNSANCKVMFRTDASRILIEGDHPRELSDSISEGEWVESSYSSGGFYFDSVCCFSASAVTLKSSVIQSETHAGSAASDNSALSNMTAITCWFCFEAEFIFHIMIKQRGRW